MINKLTMAFIGMILSVNFAYSQRSSTTASAENTPIDYRDTWQSPYVTDEMTVDPEQNKSWRMGEYKFPAKPKHSWEFGIHGGHFFIDGDVDKNLLGGYGIGLHLRKAINYTFSIRSSIFYGEATGIEKQPSRHRNNTGANGVGGGLVESTFDVYDPMRGGPGEWFPAYKTTYISGDVAAIFNVGNLLFHRERNKWNLYFGIGVGLNTHKARLDLLDSNGLPYDGISERIGWTAEEFDTKAGRDRIKQELEEIYDGDYETEGFKQAGIFRLGDDMNIHFVLIPSVGLSRKINKRINIGIEHSVYLSDNDYLDGIKFRTSLDQTNNLDVAHYTSVRIGINLGNFKKVTEPLYWMNPIDQAYNDIAQLKSQDRLDLVDEDNDGVIDLLDQELNTPEDCPVDTRGVLLDSDGDGLADCEDKEPYTRPGCPVDAQGVGQCSDDKSIDKDRVLAIVDERLENYKSSLPENQQKKDYQSGPITLAKDGSQSFETQHNDGSVSITTKMPNGEVSSIRRYNDGSVETITAGLDDIVKSELVEASGLKTSITEYPDGTQIVVKENSDGSTNRITKDTDGRIEQEIKYPDGSSDIVIQDKDGNVMSDRIAADGTTSTISSRTDGVVKAQTKYEDGRVETYMKESDGRMTKTESGLDGSIITTRTFADGHIEKTMNEPNGRKTLVTLETDGTLTREVTSPNGTYERTTQKPDGELSYESLDENGVLTNVKERADGSQRIVTSNDNGIISDEEFAAGESESIMRINSIDNFDMPEISKITDIRSASRIPDFPSINETSSQKNVASTNIIHSGCGDWFLPMIHYDLNKSVIKPQYYSHLHNVAEVMRKCPDVCVVAQGHTDNRHSNEYNTVLSYKRAKAAVDYLTERYDIDRSRIKLMYGGEESPMVISANTEAQHFMNRRVEFRTCENGDTDMEAPKAYVPEKEPVDLSPSDNKPTKAKGY